MACMIPFDVGAVNSDGRYIKSIIVEILRKKYQYWVPRSFINVNNS